MAATRTLDEPGGPTTLVYARPFVLLGVTLWCGFTFTIAGTAALAELTGGGTRVEPGFWYIGGPFCLISAVALPYAVAQWLDPAPAVEVRRNRLILRQPLFEWTRGRRIDPAEIVRMYPLGDGKRSASGEGGVDRLRIDLSGGRTVKYEAVNLALSGVELDRLIREATGLTCPGWDGDGPGPTGWAAAFDGLRRRRPRTGKGERGA